MSWEKGRDVFDRLLIDGDAAINSGNWMWLSASAFFYQYFRVYSPVTYGKKYDKNGDFVRHFLPVLKVSHPQASVPHAANASWSFVCAVWPTYTLQKLRPLAWRQRWKAEMALQGFCRPYSQPWLLRALLAGMLP